MKILKFIRPEKPLKELKWYDIAIVTTIMFGQFIVWSTQAFIASFQPVAQAVSTATETATNTATDGAAYSSNFTLQIILLAIALAYLLLRISILNSCRFASNGLSSFGYPLSLPSSVCLGIS